MHEPDSTSTGRNRRTAIVLATIVLVFFAGFVVRQWLFG